MVSDSLKKGERAAKNSAIISFLLLIIKGIVGFLSGSIVLISDALDSSLDLLMITASWFGLKVSQRKPDEKFPYGYYKAESITLLFISLLIIYAAFELIKTGFLNLFTKSIILIPLLAIIVALISSITSYILSRYLKVKGEEINSQLLITSSKERLTDCFKSGIVFLTIMLSYYGIPYLEGIMTIIISALILKIGLFSVKDSIIALMDVSPSKEIEEKIIKIMKSVKGVKDFSDLKLRKSGPFIFGDVIIKIKKFVNVKKAHEIADSIEEEIKEKIKQADSFVVHVEPFKSLKQKIVIPIKGNKGLDSAVINHFGRADNFLFINLKSDKVKSFYVKKNIYKKKRIRAGLHAVNFVIKEEIDVLITNQIGQISFHILKDNLVDIYKTKGVKVKDIINNFINNELERLKKSTRRKD